MLEWRIVGSDAHLVPITESSARRLCHASERNRSLDREQIADENRGARRCSRCYRIAYQNKITTRSQHA
jgi:hypothetical protein